MNDFQLLRDYLRWYITSNNRHGIHSPFMYKFLDQCLYAGEDKSIFDDIESQRIRLVKSRQIITYRDLGAGTRKGVVKSPEGLTSQSVGQIARNSLQPPKYTRLFYRMARYFKFNNILEMGTSFGITTAYLSRAVHQGGKIQTIEGAAPIADIAGEVFNNLDCSNITQYRGNFSDLLPRVAIEHGPWDMIFLDGDHNGHAVSNYFSFLVKHISSNGVLIVDDIRWSPSMWEAWNDIKKHPEVKVTVDLFYMGLVFFHSCLSHEHFSMRF